MKEKWGNYKTGIATALILLIFVLVFWNWISECIHPEGYLKEYNNSEKYEYTPLSTNTDYTQSFYCIGSGMDKVTVYLNNGKSMGELSPEEAQQRFITPFYIWTNYDIEERYYDKLSANYLSSLILTEAGYSLTGYEAFLYRLSEQYPVISVSGVWSADGQYYRSVAEISDDLLTDYEYLQYYRMQGS